MKIRLQTVPMLLAGCIMIILSSCYPGGQGGKPRSTGSASELLVITDSKEIWSSPLGDTIRDWFSQPMLVLPQTEPMFDLLNVTTSNFGDLFQKFHNILIVGLDSSLSVASSETMRDTWSSPQQVIRIKAPNADAFYEEFRKNRASYLLLFNQLERKRIYILNQMSGDPGMVKKISSKFGLSVDVPGGFYIATDAPDFMWIRHTEVKGKQDVELGIMIYYTNYQDTAQLSEKYILNWRNIITRQHIPGGTAGSYMKVADEFIRPMSFTPQDFPLGYAVETRGLWDVQNDFMGGPFISFTFVDEKRNRLFTLDGYIYNPNEFKRNFMRQIESIFYTVRLPD